MSSRGPASTVAAFEAQYQQALYEVHAPQGVIVLRIGEHSAVLAALLDGEGASTAAFVSADNPRGECVSAHDNALAFARLQQAAHELSLPTLPGAGRDPVGNWPVESSLLIIGCPLVQARELGRRFAQNAILWIGADVVPRLEWI